MKWYCYVVFNTQMNAFERPIITFHEKDEFVEVLKRDYRASDVNNRAKLAKNKCYFIGLYDDNTGKIDVVDQELILDLSTLEMPVEEKANG